MGRHDLLQIERWELENILDAFRLMLNSYPTIKDRKSCTHRMFMDAYNSLADLYNGEKRKEFTYLKEGQVPVVKFERR